MTRNPTLDQLTYQLLAYRRALAVAQTITQAAEARAHLDRTCRRLRAYAPYHFLAKHWRP